MKRETVIGALWGLAGWFAGSYIGAMLAPRVISDDGVVRACSTDYGMGGGLIGLIAGIVLSALIFGDGSNTEPPTPPTNT